MAEDADEKLSWLDDPKVARLMARMTWIVLVATFVMLTRFASADPTFRHGAVALLLVVVAILNAPVINGLWNTRSMSHKAAYRAVAAGLGMRAFATFGVVLFLSA